MAGRTTVYVVPDACCADEERVIRKKLESTPGIESVGFNLVARRLTVRHTCGAPEVEGALRAIGFPPRADGGVPGRDESRRARAQLASTLAAAGLMAAGIACSAWEAAETYSAYFYAGSILAGGWRIGLRALTAARNLAADMNLLMTAAVIGAAAIGRWEEAAAVIVLFSLSHVLEEYSMHRSRAAMTNLMSLAPATADVVRNGAGETVALEEIRPGEIVTIRPGGRIPLDGKVVSGDSWVDQAPITGESALVRKRPGDEVFAGSLNQLGTLDVAASRPYSDTTLARLIRLVEEAQSTRAPSQGAVDRFARTYTPAVMGAAVLVAAVPPLLFSQPFGVWFYKALVLLVIACPCALVISTPVTIVSALSNAARHGVLIKGGRVLEDFSRIRAIAFDKTGTLTQGVPVVTDVVPLGGMPREEILRLAAAAEAQSEHPLAAAVLRKAGEERLLTPRGMQQRFETVAGRGVKATVDGTDVMIGSHAMLEEEGNCSEKIESLLARLEAEGKTAVVLSVGGTPAGILGISDELRPESRRVVGLLHDEGIRKVVMLTGDNEGTARPIAEAAGIDEVQCGVMPDEKAGRIRELSTRYGGIAMVGDGINDAPALAAATVGVAMGGAGNDIAMESAHMVLMSDDLLRLPYVARLSRRAVAIIRQNIAIALSTKLVFLVLAATGMATLWSAVLADDGAALVVILNGLRALHAGPAGRGRGGERG